MLRVEALLLYCEFTVKKDKITGQKCQELKRKLHEALRDFPQKATTGLTEEQVKALRAHFEGIDKVVTKHAEDMVAVQVQKLRAGVTKGAPLTQTACPKLDR